MPGPASPSPSNGASPRPFTRRGRRRAPRLSRQPRRANARGRDEAVRRPAAAGMVPWLSDLLADPEGSVRDGRRALGRTSGRRAVDALMGAADRFPAQSLRWTPHAASDIDLDGLRGRARAPRRCGDRPGLRIEGDPQVSACRHRPGRRRGARSSGRGLPCPGDDRRPGGRGGASEPELRCKSIGFGRCITRTSAVPSGPAKAHPVKLSERFDRRYQQTPLAVPVPPGGSVPAVTPAAVSPSGPAAPPATQLAATQVIAVPSLPQPRSTQLSHAGRGEERDPCPCSPITPRRSTSKSKGHPSAAPAAHGGALGGKPNPGVTAVDRERLVEAPSTGVGPGPPGPLRDRDYRGDGQLPEQIRRAQGASS
jgi:hypothetical protein